MLASKTLAGLAAQKRILLAESDLNRQLLAVHWDHAGEPFRQWRAGWRKLYILRPYLIYLAPVAGYLLVRRKIGSVGLSSKLLFIWRLGRRAFGLWRKWNPSDEKK